ncbi:hypothetical protein NDU88_002832 [Pleurodeles waltl]|uniref:Protein phosphatase 1 regulatory subunit 19 n=1 Tax=Pleurodeles waltl TaxID=8319 RepID=A0AAV7KWR9_PLEWA|nr:hypothetical protein NDU88_002832 [Pleurodeles waltl]
MVVTSCQEKIQHWKKVESHYEVLENRLNTLPDKLSYDVMVPFGPLAFMPGRLVHTNEITVLLGDNWFAKCSAKQAISLVDHRKKHVRKTLDDLQVVIKNFESRVEFTEDLQKMSDESSDYVDIREVTGTQTIETKGTHRTAHKPHSKPKAIDTFESALVNGEGKPKSEVEVYLEKDLWARLEELERQEDLQNELESIPEATSEDVIDSEVEKKKTTNLSVTNEVDKYLTQGNIQINESESVVFHEQANGTHPYLSGGGGGGDDDEEENGADQLIPTIYFSHTMEPKRVRINTGKNTTLKFSEKKEEAKRKRKNSNGNGHTELPHIKTPADIYRVFVDVKNGEYVPRKSILKSRSRDDSICSDTSESSAAEFEDRRGMMRSLSCDDAIFFDASEGVLPEEYHSSSKHSPTSGPLEAFSGTVIEKEHFSPSIPLLSIAHSTLPTIPERKTEEAVPEVIEETTKRISKFKAARMQQRT